MTQNRKKFIIGTKAAACEDLDVYVPDDFQIINPVGNTGMMQSNSANLQAKQSLEQLFVDGEEEDEVIVFKPMAAEKDTNMGASETTTLENIQPVQSSSKCDQTTNGGVFSAAFSNIPMSASLNGILQPPITVHSVSQPPAHHITQRSSMWFMDHESFVGGLKSLSIAKNELCANPDLLSGPSIVQPTTFSPSRSATTNLNTSSSWMLSGHIMAGEAVIPAEVDSIVPIGANFNGLNMKVSAALPAPRKNPVNQPPRHFGPPPGFSRKPAKKLEESNSQFVIKEQQPPLDDYSWLDGFKISSITGMGIENSINCAPHMYPHVTASNSNSITGAIN